MPNGRVASAAKTFAIVATLIIIVGAMGVISIYYIPSLRHPSSSGTTRTCTVIYGTAPLGFWLYCPDPLRISANWNGAWNLTATISTDSVVGNEGILLKANLTSGTNQTIKQFVEPVINYKVYAANGTLLWGWNPPQTTYPNMNVSSGQTFSQNAVVPTYPLESGQAYLLEVIPVAIQFPSPDNMSFTFQFTVR